MREYKKRLTASQGGHDKSFKIYLNLRIPQITEKSSALEADL